MVPMRGARVELGKIKNKLSHDEVLEIVYKDMKNSGDYFFLAKKLEPVREWPHLKNRINDFCGEIDILGLTTYGTLEIIEVKTNGFLMGAAHQLFDRKNWFAKYKPLIEEYVFHRPFEKIDTIICYQDCGYLIFQDIDVNDKYWRRKDNEYKIPDRDQYKRMVLGGYTVPKKAKKILKKRLNH